MAYLDPIHAPCPTMEGMKEPSHERRVNSRSIIKKLRSKYGFTKKVKPQARPLNYVCTNSRCLDSWEV
ncbi:hypothetical protein [Aliivibrio logei]|uniref:hypothetical protein n=1 Tax=Aliivibrio logei TaxID=688 RepID=UPI0009F21A4E|nr:hypothetical protein [Aliivibrio logei]